MMHFICEMPIMEMHTQPVPGSHLKAAQAICRVQMSVPFLAWNMCSLISIVITIVCFLGKTPESLRASVCQHCKAYLYLLAHSHFVPTQLWHPSTAVPVPC